MEDGQQHKDGPWEIFREKVLPPLFTAATISVFAAAYSVSKSVDKLTYSVDQHTQQLADVRQEMLQIKSQYATRLEMLELLKRVELQLNLMLAQQNNKAKIKLAD